MGISNSLNATINYSLMQEQEMRSQPNTGDNSRKYAFSEHRNVLYDLYEKDVCHIEGGL